MTHDLVIRGGTVVDGTGAPRRIADVAIDGETITAVGVVPGKGRTEIDASGHIVTPGWVDIHTHYDGQVSWDPYLSPSCWHGVTTVVMGNCGVGFAPVKPHFRDRLINIMEGVEDIPGTALTEGITWEWETYPEYLDALAKKSYAMDVCSQVPHAAIRTYVMGEKGGDNEAASAEEIAAMSTLVGEALDAGAFGFTTSRITAHRTSDGKVVPGTQVSIDEMEGFGDALSKAGHGVFEVVSDINFDGIPGSLTDKEEIDWMSDLSRRKKVKFTYLLFQNPGNTDKWRSTIDMTSSAQAAGAELYPQVSMRPTGIIMGLQSSFHMFMGRPTYDALADLPFEEQVEKMKQPDIRAAIISEKSDKLPFEGTALRYDMMFRLEQADGTLDYEPSLESSVQEFAKRAGVSEEAILYDMMMENDGNGYIYVILVNYGDYNLNFVHELMDNPTVISAGSDAGAHCGAICDAAMPTFMLSHWTRDRKAGPTVSIEKVVERQTRATARLYDLNDRGVLAPGMKADINVIDYEKINSSRPKMVPDLPAGGKRLLQTATGYRATIVSGVVTFENGIATGALPGKLLRSAPNAFTPAAALAIA
ncbi:amidohydrolase family protein [Novosphingobium sp.]|uniref:N-acyl-D-amino-acid deacylase family protein n=1 Tax=Novosphingobium sp. TaxID=1874826 RepID=UPI00260EFCA9|nr:amidohydrolase family protein [Novosphingobium sp.]